MKHFLGIAICLEQLKVTYLQTTVERILFLLGPGLGLLLLIQILNMGTLTFLSLRLRVPATVLLS